KASSSTRKRFSFRRSSVFPGPVLQPDQPAIACSSRRLRAEDSSWNDGPIVKEKYVPSRRSDVLPSEYCTVPILSPPNPIWHRTSPPHWASADDAEAATPTTPARTARALLRVLPCMCEPP